MIRSHHHARTVFAFLAVALVANVGALARGQDDPPEPPKTKTIKKKDDNNTKVIAGRLTGKDPIDKSRPDTYAQVHTIKLKAGLEYIFDLRHTDPRASDRAPARGRR